MDTGGSAGGGKANPKAALKKAPEAMFTIEGSAAGLGDAASAA
jgi:hypothetical protein